MSNVDTLLNKHASRYFLAKGFQYVIDEVAKDLSLLSSQLAQEKGKVSFLKSSLECESQYGFEMLFEEEFSSDSRYNSDTNNDFISSIAVIDNILCGHHPDAFKFPSLSTSKLVASALSDTITTPTLITRLEVKLKMFQIFQQIIESHPSLKLVVDGDIWKNVLIYIAEFLTAVKSRYFQVIGSLVDDTVGLLKQGFEGDVPLESFVEHFNNYLKFSLRVTVAGLSQLRTANVDLVDQLRERANNLMSYSSFAQAIKIYTEALAISPKMSRQQDVQLLTNRAIAFIGLNCIPEAIDDLNLAISLDRTFTPAWTQLGYCHLYMGDGLLALECYLLALKSSVGEVLPLSYSFQDPSVREEYRSLKVKTILPQFIERLSAAIALTEKRSYQQHIPEDKIKKAVSEVRKILAHLRAVRSEEDREHFTYTPVYRDSSLRNLSERINVTRPNILTPEVSQGILARNGMEATTITSIESRHPNEGNNNASASVNINGNNNNNNNNNNTNSRIGEGTGPEVNVETVFAVNPTGDYSGTFSVGELLNRFGESVNRARAFGEQDQNGARSSNNASSGANSESSRRTNATNRTFNSATQAQASRDPTNSTRLVSDVLLQGLGSVIPPGLLSTIERVTQGAMNGTDGTNFRVFRNTPDANIQTQGASQTQTHPERTNSAQESERAEDEPSLENVSPDLD
ncbi:hypothetical protein KGF56_000081 [Candida oxycetoniae]|uniref:Uncharacterized protein n=1 Tax=Candida oxycetoniae TaxID=497107 RepID=A0AAI9T1D2_9ASCO|nr:uncharacterized protein KGF56_000081 [Candida oxycetoniae]KAI3407093.2 hypothetical protein KGF56_000081 [Candida oxycetoniae]